MRVSFGLPLYDVRPFIASPTRRIMPPWLVAEKKDFLRSFGNTRERSGSHTPWTGEDRFCRATHALRFANPLRSQKIGSDDEPRARFECRFRGLLRTHPTGMFRFEVLLARDRPQPSRAETSEAPLSERGFAMLIDSLWGLAVNVGPSSATTPTTLIRSGPALADHLLGATTARRPSTPLPERWWVGAGEPITIVEHQASEVIGLPLGFRNISLESSSDLTLSYGVGPGGGVFVARRENPAYDKDELNRLYLHLLRLHTEVETFYAIARLLLRDPPLLAPDGSATNDEALTNYFEESSRILSGRFLAGYETDAVLTEAFTVHQRVNRNDYETLLSIVADFNARAANRYRRVMDPGNSSPGTAYVFLPNSNARFLMGNSTNINTGGGDVYNSGVIGSGNFVQDSFKQIETSGASDQLKEELKKLVEAVAALAPHVTSAAEGDQLGADVQSFTAEATSAKPRKAILQSFGDAITTAAKTIGQHGLPVVKVVGAILALV
jgi:hypothetical protein